jgi:hypothetical protein
VGLENTYLVKKDSVESLTRFPKQLVQLWYTILILEKILNKKDSMKQ